MEEECAQEYYIGNVKEVQWEQTPIRRLREEAFRCTTWKKSRFSGLFGGGGRQPVCRTAAALLCGESREPAHAKKQKKGWKLKVNLRGKAVEILTERGHEDIIYKNVPGSDDSGALVSCKEVPK